LFFSLELKTSPPSLLFEEEELKNRKPLFEEGFGEMFATVRIYQTLEGEEGTFEEMLATVGIIQILD
jgi:hypothetical protein